MVVMRSSVRAHGLGHVFNSPAQLLPVRCLSRGIAVSQPVSSHAWLLSMSLMKGWEGEWQSSLAMLQNSGLLKCSADPRLHQDVSCFVRSTTVLLWFRSCK